MTTPTIGIAGRIALVHHLLAKVRGGERVLEAIMELCPEAPVYTLLAVRGKLPEPFRSREIVTSWFDRLPAAQRLYKPLLPLVPLAFESFDLSRFDMVITSDSMLAKGVVTGAETFHVCYCHSPPRYLWDLAATYRRHEVPWALRPAWDLGAHWLRVYDLGASHRVDHFIANSTAVQGRIARHYRREAEVIFPPVDTEYFTPANGTRNDTYVYAGELLAYKRPGLLLEAFRDTGRRLRIVGGGPLYRSLKRQAPPNVSVEGPLPRDELRRAFREARAFLFAGEEDFGITLVEAQACGTPVVAFDRGGARDTVVPGRTGVFIEAQTVEGVREALHRFERSSFDGAEIRRHAESFGRARFQAELCASVRRRFSDWTAGHRT